MQSQGCRHITKVFFALSLLKMTKSTSHFLFFNNCASVVGEQTKLFYYEKNVYCIVGVLPWTIY